MMKTKYYKSVGKSKSKILFYEVSFEPQGEYEKLFTRMIYRNGSLGPRNTFYSKCGFKTHNADLYEITKEQFRKVCIKKRLFWESLKNG